jgi:hypothetical protein
MTPQSGLLKTWNAMRLKRIPRERLTNLAAPGS